MFLTNIQSKCGLPQSAGVVFLTNVQCKCELPQSTGVVCFSPMFSVNVDCLNLLELECL